MLRELLARAKVDGDGGKKAVGEWEVPTNKFIFKYVIGDLLGDIPIVQIKNGLTRKILIIGRQMRDHVYVAAENLISQGYVVEILNDDYLKRLYDEGFEFVIEGKKWTVQSAWEDMTKNSKYDIYRDLNGYIKIEYLDQTIMFKLNKTWIEKANNEGYTILDIGYPKTHDMSLSGFYEMEKSSVNWNK